MQNTVTLLNSIFLFYIHADLFVFQISCGGSLDPRSIILSSSRELLDGGHSGNAVWKPIKTRSPTGVCARCLVVRLGDTKSPDAGRTCIQQFEACCHPLMTVGAYDYGRPQENLIIWVSSQGQLMGIVSRVPGTVTMPTPGRALWEFPLGEVRSIEAIIYVHIIPGASKALPASKVYLIE